MSAPIAAPALLAMYLDQGGARPKFEDIEKELGLLPADEAADVALLWPSNDRVVEDPWAADGVQFVNLPQLAVDCLGGSGRMPSEGDALLGWMQANTDDWQYPSLAAYRERRR